MHTPFIAGAYFTLACILCVGGGLWIAAHLLGRRNANFLLFGLMMMVVSVQTIGTGFDYLHGAGSNIGSWAAGLAVATAAALIAAALHAHLAIQYFGVKRQVTWAMAAYFLAGVLGLFILRGDGILLDQAQSSRLVVLGLEIQQTRAPRSWFAYAYFLAIPVLHLVACTLFGKAYLQGRREGMGMFIGAGIFTLSAVNDSLVGANIIRGLYLAPAGALLFSVVMVVGFLRRYRMVRQEYDRLTRALNERAKQLRKARITLRELQSELGRKEQLAAIGEMAAVIAHEVRNPLAVISNAVASLRRNSLSKHDHDLLLSILDEEAVRLNRLVSDLLNYARPISLQRQRVVLHDILQRATILSTRHDAKVVYEDSSVRGQIWGDGNLLRQVFDNLVENAVQATGGAGSVVIEVNPGSRDGREGFVVTVMDDGEGMDTQVRNRAKDPFFTTRPSGTGLGLAIVNRVVEAHGGEMWFESRAGEGTTVSVFLPIGTESSPPADARRYMDTVPPMSQSDERPIYERIDD